MWKSLEIENQGFKIHAEFRFQGSPDDPRVDHVRNIIICKPKGVWQGMPRWAAEQLVDMETVFRIAAERHEQST